MGKSKREWPRRWRTDGRIALHERLNSCGNFMSAFLQGRGEDIEECVRLKGEWERERNGFAGRSACQLKESGNQGLRRSKASSR